MNLIDLRNGPDLLSSPFPTLYIHRSSPPSISTPTLRSPHTQNHQNYQLMMVMMAGKRPRPPFRRTTSMIGIIVDPVEYLPEPEPLLGFEISPPIMIQSGDQAQTRDLGSGGQSLMVSPRNHRRRKNNDTNCLETAHFLRTCGLCQRRLAPARDIYMYRGDTAFCSQECREQQMERDNRRDKSSKDEHHHHHHHRNHPSATATSTASGKPETVAAA